MTARAREKMEAAFAAEFLGYSFECQFTLIIQYREEETRIRLVDT